MQSGRGWSRRGWKLPCNLTTLHWPQLSAGCSAHSAGSIRLTRHPCTVIVYSQTHPAGERGWWAGGECDLFVVVFRLVSEVARRFFRPSLPFLRGLEINRTALAIYTDACQVGSAGVY